MAAGKRNEICMCPHCGKPIVKLGSVLRDTLDTMQTIQPCTSRELADRMGITINNASNRLAKLCDMGLATRVDMPQPSGGYEYAYTRK